MSLDRATILDAGLALIDERGLDGFTLRALGTRLGLSQMAVYHHFPNKDAIIDAMAERILDGIRLAPDQRSIAPDERILGYARRFRVALLEHPELVPAVASRPLTETVDQADLQMLLDTFRDAGFPEPMVVTSVLALASTVLGLVLWESRRLGQARAGLEATEPDVDGDGDGDGRATAATFTSRVTAAAWAESNFDLVVQTVQRGLKESAPGAS